MAEDVAGDLPVTARLVIPAAELQWRFSRSSGPGGQSVNTTDSRVELEWTPSTSTVLSDAQRDRLAARLGHRLVAGAVVVRASESRSQWQNRRAARVRLAEIVRTVLAPPPRRRRPTRPSRSSVERRLAAKHRRGAVKRGRGQPDEEA